MDKGISTRHESHKGREERVAYVCACIRIVVVAWEKVTVSFQTGIWTGMGCQQEDSVGTV